MITTPPMTIAALAAGAGGGVEPRLLAGEDDAPADPEAGRAGEDDGEESRSSRG